MQRATRWRTMTDLWSHRHNRCVEIRVFEKTGFTSAEFESLLLSLHRELNHAWARLKLNSQIDAIIITWEPEADNVTARRQHEDRCQNDWRAWLQARRDVSVTHSVWRRKDSKTTAHPALFCSPRLHLFDQKYSKNCNIVIYYCNFKYLVYVLIYQKM